MGIFSRWEERDLKFAKVEPDGWSESSNHEDDFIGVRAPYKWRPGKYCFTLTVVEPRKKNVWVEMSIQSLTERTTKRIGALAFPGTLLTLSRDFCSFVEFSEAPSPRRTTPD